MRCPGCTYPAHAFAGTIDVDADPDQRFAYCAYQSGTLTVSFSQASVIDREHPVGHGSALTIVLGYNPYSGWDLGRLCQILVEEDDRQWGASCSNDPVDCRVVPNLVGDKAELLRKEAAVGSPVGVRG